MNQSQHRLEVELNRLREENEQVKAQYQQCLDFDRLNWHLSMTMNTKLQLSSTSIKAAVSSLLDRNIFWEVSAQQEFLETIRQSIDQISDRLFQMALVNLLHAGSLDVSLKFYVLHELMREVQERSAQTSGKDLHYQDFVAKGSLVFVDYRCFVHALSILFSIVNADGALSLSLDSESRHYVLSLSNLPDSVLSVVQSIIQKKWEADSLYHDLPAEKVYGLILVVRLLEYQGIHLLLDMSQPKGMRIEIPFVEPENENSG